MRSRKLVTVAASSLLMVVAAAGCGSSAGPSASTSAATSTASTLKIATTTDVVNYNPLVGSSRTDDWVTALMYPRLLTINSSGSKVACLATAWGYSDPTHGYYDIRSDMKWSDGEPLTAADVAYTMNAIKQDKPAGTTYGQMTNFVSAQAASATRVVLSLSKPDATVVPEIGFWMNVVPQHVFSKAGSVATFPNASNWVSAGPYKLVNVVKGQSYTLDRVTPYPLAGNGTPVVKEIVYKVYPDVNTEILALKNGDVDLIANALPPAQVKPLQSVSGITVQQVPGLGYEHLAYNMARKPLDNLQVRQALAHAIDYQAIRAVVLRGQAVSTGSSPIPPVLTSWVDSSLKEYSFDPKLSRQLLQQAGYKADGSGTFPLSLNMIYSLQDPVTSGLANIVKDDAAQAGITINLQGMERNTYLAKTNAGDYDIYAGNFAIMDDPATNMTLTYLPGGAINYSHVDVPQLSSLITQAQATADRSQQKKLVTQAATDVHDNVYDNVIFMQNLYIAHSAKWTGFVVEPSELLSIINPQSLASARSAG